MIKSFRLLCAVTAAAALSGCASLGGAGSTPAIATETFMVPSDPGVQIHVRNKFQAGQSKFNNDRVVIFVHGATYPSTVFFDADLPGGRWMDIAAQQGFDAYTVDIRGYGGSTRPAAMSQPASDNPPFADTADAMRDLSAVVEFVRQRRGVQKVSLVGWSWGTTITAGFTAQNNDKVHKLSLHAPLWKITTASPISGSGAYRVATRDAVRARGLRGIPAERTEEISPTPWFNQWWTQVQATDPEGAKLPTPGVRAPNGVLKDIGQYWAAGKPTYDPAQIRVPTQITIAEWDQDTPISMSYALFPLLTNAPERRLDVLTEGTHAIGLEKNRMQLIRKVQAFLQ